MSVLNDEQLESILALSDFLTRYHSQFATFPPDANGETDDDDDTTDQTNGLNKDSSDINSTSQEDQSSHNRDRVVISPQDVLSAIDYRHDVERYNVLAVLIRTVQQPNYHGSGNSNWNSMQNQDLDKLLQEENKRLWLRMQSRVEEGRMSTDQDVIGVIETLEVKVAKEISTHLLLDAINKNPVDSSGEGEGRCAIPSCSTLLGMPSGNYLSTVLPKCLYNEKERGSGNEGHNNEQIPTLAVPANVLTWKELLRLSEMVSKVDDEDREAIYSSHLTYTHMTRMDLRGNGGKQINLYSKERLSGDDKMLLSTHSELRGTDLVALWVRAQRDTGASRHLLALFDINEVRDEKTAKESEHSRMEVIDVDAADKGIPKEISFVPDPQLPIENLCSPRYTASFVGNPPKLRNRIEKEAPMMDKLTEWAVMNQILFTQEYTRTLVADSDSLEPSTNGRKRGAESALSPNDCPQRKRVYQDIPENLQIAYQSYILRWFVRRNCNILRMVCTSSHPDDAKYMASMGINFTDAVKQIKAYLSEHYDSTDRTIARIDRRILIGKFSQFVLFKEAVNQLLEALGSVLSRNENALDQVKCANEDFTNLCAAVLPSEEHDYMPLLKSKPEKGKYGNSYAGAEETADILKSHPRPWPDEKCSTCSQQMSEKTRLTCSNCGECEHTICLRSQSVRNPERPLRNDPFRYLTGVYMSMKDLPQVPDFVKSPINWEKKVIRMERKASGEGILPKWGIVMHNTESCSEELDEGMHHFMDPTRWQNIHDFKRFADVLPMRVPHSGLIVTSCQGPSMISGLEPGDVIVEVQILNEQTSILETKVLKEIQNGDDRKSLMGTPSEKMACTVYRPSTEIVSIAQQFNAAISNAYNDSVIIHTEIMKELWYCNRCKEDPQPSQSVEEEALMCQAVIRRIGMDECFLSFHDEDAPLADYDEDIVMGGENDEEVISLTSRSSSDDNKLNLDHFDHIGLRRLDQIMTYISSSAKDRSSDKCLYTPPWTDREKLCWARSSLVSHPIRLLCAGMLLIIRRAKNIGFNERKIEPLVRTFINTFVPWCLDYRARVSIGPPLNAKVATAPWLFDSCKGCALRGVPNRSSTFCSFCAGRKSRNDNDQEDGGREELIEEEAVTVDATLYSEHLSHNEILRYDLHSSYVGTSFLISIDDPLVNGVLEKTNLIVDEGRRNVELLVISYIPKSLIKKDERDALVYEQFRGTFDDHWQTAEGLFYILPILSHYQMNYISQFCDKREPGTPPSISAMLALEGVIALTPLELMTRLQASFSMQDAIDRAVGSIAAKFGKSKIPMMVVESDSDRQGDEKTFSQLQMLDYDFMSITHVLCSDDLPRLPNLRCLQPNQLLWAIEFCVKRPKLYSLASRLNIARCTQHTGAIESFIVQTCERKPIRGKRTERSTGLTQSVMRYLSNMICFDESEAEKRKDCNVCYSDFLYWRPSSTKRAEQKIFNLMEVSNKTVANIPLLHPRPFDGNASNIESIAIVLHREFGRGDEDGLMIDSDEEYSPEEEEINGIRGSSSSPKFRGRGWGVELIRWSADKRALRVGRVAPGSPAETSGLKMHDVVTCINGFDVKTALTNSQLADNLLGEFHVAVTDKCEKFPAAPYLFNRRNRNAAKGPVVLSILRSESPTPRLSRVLQPQQHSMHTSTNTPSVQKSPAQRNNTNRHIQYKKKPDVRPTSSKITAAQPIPHLPLTHRPQPITHYHHTQTNQPHPTTLPNPLMSSHHQSPTQNNLILPAELLPSTSLPRDVLVLQKKHLYSGGVNGTFLSLVEVSVMMHSISQNNPRLSTRLLQPRYASKRINDEYIRLIKPFVEKYAMDGIPTLTDHMWQSVLNYDLKRMQDETGPIAFVENNFGYREPNQIFPIDRFFEQYFLEQQKRNAHTRAPGMDFSDALRIRGGGTEGDVDSDVNKVQLRCGIMNALDSIALNEIEGKWILGKTANNTVLVGMINMSSQSDGIALIACIYSSDKGTYACETILILDPKSHITLVPNVIDGDTYNDIVQKALHHLNNLQRKSGIDDNERDELYFTLLGILPDGRSLHWFASDPKAVYICTAEERTSTFMPPIDFPELLASFERNATDSKSLGFPSVNFTQANTSFFCPWGCCAKPESSMDEPATLSMLTFDSLKEWQDHINISHSYSSRSNNRFQRIGDGISIQDLCADLTSHICSISTSFYKFVRHYEREGNDNDTIGVQNHPKLKSISFDVHSFPRLPNNYIDLSILNGRENVWLLGRSLRVWDRLVYLFSVEDSGKLRSKFSSQKAIQVRAEVMKKDDAELTNLLDSVEAGMSESPSSDQIKILKKVMHPSCIRTIFNERTNLNCQLCNGITESCMESQNNESCHGFGCGLTSSICFTSAANVISRDKLLDAIKAMLPTKGDLDVLKALVLKIAANMPQSLYAPKMPMFADIPLSTFWEDIDSWIRFTSKCLNIRMVAQAFIALQSSINKQKLPRWWKSSKFGWSASMLTMQNPTISKIAFLLFTLDIAISEYMATTKDDLKKEVEAINHYAVDGAELEQEGEQSKGFLQKIETMTVKNRYKLLETLAAKFGLPPHDDEYAEECMHCSIGGDLICCEYCQNVCHHHCLGITDSLEEVVFVCKECIIDIATLKDAWDREVANNRA